MIKQIKLLLSYLWPFPIALGESLTIKDSEESYRAKIKQNFNRRVNRTTAKFRMQYEYSIYELVNITKDMRTNEIIYTVEHCATGHHMKLDDITFKLLFKRET